MQVYGTKVDGPRLLREVNSGLGEGVLQARYSRTPPIPFQHRVVSGLPFWTPLVTRVPIVYVTAGD